MLKTINLSYQNNRQIGRYFFRLAQKFPRFLGMSETLLYQDRLTFHSKNKSIERGHLVYRVVRWACLNRKTKLTFHRYHCQNIFLSEVLLHNFQTDMIQGLCQKNN